MSKTPMKFCQCLCIWKLAPHMWKSFYAYFAEWKALTLFRKWIETLRKDKCIIICNQFLKFYKFLLNFNDIYFNLQNITKLYTTHHFIPHCSSCVFFMSFKKQCKRLQNFKLFYKTLQNFIINNQLLNTQVWNKR
jgi:hypothetical protein